MKSGVVLVSGGLDSLVTAAIADKECDLTYFLHFNYGQKTETKELESFRKIVNHYSPKDILISNLDFFKMIGSSSLIDESQKIRSYHNINQLKKDSKPNTYVPFRNALMLSIGVSWAEAVKANYIYIGAVEEDSSGYPDCREVFFQAFQEVIDFGTANNDPLIVKVPLIHKSKKEIILLGKKLNTPLELSWSCYGNNHIACGKCASCFLRLKAFQEAGLIDPVKYE